MNLGDVITGGLVFSLASASSMQIYATSLGWAGGHRGRQQHAVASELALVQVAQQFRQRIAAGELPGGSCEQVAADLVAALEALPLAAGLQHTVRQDQELVRFTLQAPGLPRRQRWFSPAAYGLCGGEG